MNKWEFQTCLNKTSIMTLLRNGGAIASFAIIAILLLHFHDQFWWPADEGVYAYVAQRILAGDIIHRDLIDFHADYGNFINAAAFLLFGEDLLSLRYPLIAMNLLQCIIVWILLRPKGAMVASAGIIGVGCFTFLPFMNPSFNWYALPSGFLMALLLEKWDARQARTLIAAGLIIGICFFTRQLNGVLLAMASLSWLLLRLTAPAPAPRWPVWTLTAIMAIALVGYIANRESLGGLGLFGLWPLGILFVVAYNARIELSECARMIGLLSIGFLLGAFPLFLYYAVNGSVMAWLNDVIVTAMQIDNFKTKINYDFAAFLIQPILLLQQNNNPLIWFNVIMFLGKMLLPTITGERAWVMCRRQPKQIPALPLIAIFWAVSIIHHPSITYLYFVLPLTVVAILSMYPTRWNAIIIMIMSGWMVIFHVGQPNRLLNDALAGVRMPMSAKEGLQRASLQIETDEYKMFNDLLERIESEKDKWLFAFPHQTIINFMTERPSPIPYYHTALFLNSDIELTKAQAQLVNHAPLFVVYNNDYPWHTPYVLRLLQTVRENSPPPEKFGDFDLYRFNPGKKTNEN